MGGVKVGGNAPVSIQSMTKVATADFIHTIAQIKELEKCGCEIVRVAIKDIADAEAVRFIKRKIHIPLVCDIHFHYKLALEAIKNGADKIRLNPGNLRERAEIIEVIKAAKKARIPIRIGVNSGSLVKGRSGEGFVGSARQYIKLFEDNDFRDIIISLKSSDVVSTVDAYRKISALYDYPLHLGVTAAGPYDFGIVKSAIGIGALVLDGIGDTIRVSLTGDPVEEVLSAKRILSSLGVRKFGPDIISCPTCGRCHVDLVKVVSELESQLSAISCQSSAKKPLTVAIMGCEVNGPGEAKEADIGIAFGKGNGIIFKNGKIIKRVAAKNAVKELLKLI